MSSVTQILDAVAGGTPGASEALLPLVARSQFEQARAIRLSERPGHRWHGLDLLKQAESLRQQESARVKIDAGDRRQQPVTLPTRPELRSEALAALVVNDGRVLRETEGLYHAVSPDGRFSASLVSDLAASRMELVLCDLVSGQQTVTWQGAQAAGCRNGKAASATPRAFQRRVDCLQSGQSVPGCEHARWDSPSLGLECGG